MNQDQLFDMIENYFNSIGVSAETLNNLLDRQQFRQASAKRLPDTCLREYNRPVDGNQSHIAITGNDRFVFYDRITADSSNERITVYLINENLLHLQSIENTRREHYVNNQPLRTSNYQAENALSFIHTYTHKKISGRGLQVQISNIRSDGLSFLQLRDATFLGDVLIFMQYIENPDTYVVLVLPNINSTVTSFRGKSHRVLLTNSSSVSNESQDSQTSEINHNRTRFNLNEVNSQTIARYTRNDTNESRLFDLSAANEIRAERTERHQTIVRNLAALLENASFTLYEGNIDCLAVKENEPILIFEVKTLDGSAVDEANQVKKALSQLLYYERFATQEYRDLDSYKFVVFENAISNEHIEFLQEHNCLVLYLTDTSNLNGSDEALRIINQQLHVGEVQLTLFTN